MFPVVRASLGKDGPRTQSCGAIPGTAQQTGDLFTPSVGPEVRFKAHFVGLAKEAQTLDFRGLYAELLELRRPKVAPEA